MNEAEAAFAIACKYALSQLHWYETYAFWKYLFFRATGVASIVLTVLITYISASLTAPEEKLGWFKKKNFIAVLAAFSAILVGVSSFFDWRGAWESHRIAEFEIRALIKKAEIEKLALIEADDVTGVFKLAQSLTADVHEIVEAETGDYFSRQPDMLEQNPKANDET